MGCTTHTDREAANRCTGCAEPFCADCLVEVKGLPYCGSCKTMAVNLKAVESTGGTEGRIWCKEARESLTMALISVFCFGFILGPVAVSKGIQARRAIAEDADLKGDGMALAGIVLGVLNTIYTVLGLIVKFAS